MITAETMLRVGIVSSVSADGKTARVTLPDAGNMVSGELFIVSQPATLDLSLSMNSAGDHHHQDSNIKTDGSHKHSLNQEVKFKNWVPTIGEKVLCIFMCGSETDGFILGAIS